MKTKLFCDRCGNEIWRYPSQVKTHNFCSRKCLSEFSSRIKNPDGYRQLKNYTNISKHMSDLNRKMNPKRMDFATRAKLSTVKRESCQGKSYIKSFGRHLHRTVAERMLGRKLKSGEVVHHIDGNKQNNAPGNLKVFRNQAEHLRWHLQNGGGDAR